MSVESDHTPRTPSADKSVILSRHVHSVRHVHSSRGFGISTNHPAATAAADAVRSRGGGVFDMFVAALACAWVADPANCSPFGRMQGIWSIDGAVNCLGAATRIRPGSPSVIPVPGNIAAVFEFAQAGRLRLRLSDLLTPAIEMARAGFTPQPATTIFIKASAAHMSDELRSIYLDERGNVRSLVRNPALADMLEILVPSVDEDDLWQRLRASDPGPWRVDERLCNPVQEVIPRKFDFVGPDGRSWRLLATGNIETWGTWTLLGVAIAIELRNRGALSGVARAMEAYALSTILLLDSIPFAVGTLRPKVSRPTVDIDIPSEARRIADRVLQLLHASNERLWSELKKTYFVGEGSFTDDANTNSFCFALGEDFLSFTSSIGPWFGARVSWWGAGLGYSYAMKSGSILADQTHDFTEMSPVILICDRQPQVAMSGAGSERILGGLTWLLFLKFGLGRNEPLADLMLEPRLFPKDGAIRVHENFSEETLSHLSARGFDLKPAQYSARGHIGITNLVERIGFGVYRSGADPSGDGEVL